MDNTKILLLFQSAIHSRPPTQGDALGYVLFGLSARPPHIASSPPLVVSRPPRFSRDKNPALTPLTKRNPFRPPRHLASPTQHPAFPPSKDGEKCSKCRFLKCVKTLTVSCKRGENVLSLCSEKRGYAPRAYPLFCCIEYQRLTKPEDVHVAPPGCTCRKNSKYSRRSGAYFRGEKPPFCPAKFLSRSRKAMVYS